jgi:hypothetical protein
MFVKVGFVIAEADRILVPARSLVERSEVTAAYVFDAGGRTSMRQVRVGDRFGDRFGDRVEILSGLATGERVALDPLGAMKELRPGTAAARSSR